MIKIIWLKLIVFNNLLFSLLKFCKDLNDSVYIEIYMYINILTSPLSLFK